ncbi:MAG TPA: DNA methyltransferase [Streptosporangiaceae bacterium]|nr:DNA methyltransferase [Streptosporangiaceae bacterium]
MTETTFPWPVHPAAELFPLLGDDELRELAEDVKAHGLREPVWLYMDRERGPMLLDGRNRVRACVLAGVPWTKRFYEGDDPIGFSVSLNLKRRHLTAGQIAFVGLQAEELYADEAKEQISMARRAAVAQRADRRERIAKAHVERNATPRDQHGIPLEDTTDEQRRAFREEHREDDRVYFAVSGDGNRVKIGKTWNVAARLEDLRRGDPALRSLGSIPGSFEIEHALHKRFRGHRLDGEWFSYEPISEAIAALIQKCGDRTFVSPADVAAPVDTLAKTAAAVGVGRRTMAQAKRLLNEAPDLADKVRAGHLAIDRAERIIRDREAEQRRIERARAEAAAQPAPAVVDIRVGDFRDALADLRDIDAIITDPPYPHEFIPLLEDLAIWADKVLSPDGVLAVLMGQTYLPEVYRLLGGHRPYRWTGCYLTPGNGYASMARRVQSNWKPLIVYGGGPRFTDIIRSEGQDAAAKSLHRWGQDYAAFHTIIERLTERGQTVADPFMGSGTTLLAAHALGRHAIGADADPAAVATARERLS